MHGKYGDQFILCFSWKVTQSVTQEMSILVFTGAGCKQRPVKNPSENLIN
jgi:hypothetical protein